MKKLLLFLLLVSAISCKKDIIYEVDDVSVNQPGGDKSNVKTTAEFISIAYADLYSTTIPTDSLLNISVAYEAFGDKKLIEDMIIRHFLNSPSIQLPSESTMRADVGTFVNDAIQKLYNRKADAFEKFYISDIINKNSIVKPAMVYYALMTADEYRYY